MRQKGGPAGDGGGGGAGNKTESSVRLEQHHPLAHTYVGEPCICPGGAVGGDGGASVLRRVCFVVTTGHRCGRQHVRSRCPLRKAAQPRCCRASQELNTHSVQPRGPRTFPGWDPSVDPIPFWSERLPPVGLWVSSVSGSEQHCACDCIPPRAQPSPSTVCAHHQYRIIASFAGCCTEARPFSHPASLGYGSSFL